MDKRAGAGGCGGLMAAAALAVFVASGALAQNAPNDPPDAVTALTRNPGAFTRFDGQKVIRATARSANELLALTSLSESVWSEAAGIGPVDVQIKSERLAALDQLGIAYSVLIDDLEKKVEQERAEIIALSMQRDNSWFTAYKTRTEINNYMDALVAGSSGLAVTETLPGQTTIEGRTQRAIRITGPDAPGNPRSTRPAVLFNACQHAREWISPMTVMYAADQLLGAYATDARVRNIVDNVEIIIVPVTNPDGYEYTWSTNRFWRKNRRNNGDGQFGVDNNRNWAFAWGSDNGSSGVTSNETYRGLAPGSEAETSNLMNYISSIPRIRAYIDVHSYGQLVMSPWGYTDALPPDNALFLQLDNALVDAIYDTFGRVYTPGPLYTTLYPVSGGSVDWVYGAKNITALTIELRDTGQNGFALPADQILGTAQENFNAIKRFAEYAAFPFWFGWPLGDPPSTLIADSANNVQVNIFNGWGAVNASTINLWSRVGHTGEFTPIAMSPLNGTLYQATIPAAGCGQQIEFYVEATSTAGKTLRFPVGGSAAPAVASSLTPLASFSDNCETLNGWSLVAAGDSASAGRWELGVPQATNYQVGADHTPGAGAMCFVTGAASGLNDNSNDVDSGKTTLTSPAFSTVAATVALTSVDATATVSYWRSYGAAGADTMPVEISNDNGSTWTQLELVSGNQVGWVNRKFDLAGVVTPSAATRLRFTARDDAPQSTVEAQVDDVSAVVQGCRRSYADVNKDGVVDLSDFFDFFNCFDVSDPCADVNQDAIVDLSDFFDFFNAFAGS